MDDSIDRSSFESFLTGDMPSDIDVESLPVSNERIVSTRCAPLPLPRSDFGCCLAGGRLFVCGGHIGPVHRYRDEDITDDLSTYDPRSDRWHALAPRPRRAQGASLIARERYLYAFGGACPHGPTTRDDFGLRTTRAIDRYDILADRWETLGNLADGRSSFAMATHGNSALLIGGWSVTDGHPTGSMLPGVERFDFETEQSGSCSVLPPSPLRRAIASSEDPVVPDAILLAGGLTAGSRFSAVLADFWRMNLGSGRLERLPNLPVRRFGPSLARLGGTLLLAGGYDVVRHAPVASILCMESNSVSWQRCTDSPIEPRIMAATAHVGGGTLLIGGQSAAGIPTGAVELLRFA